MQPEVITLAVDKANTGTTTDKAYTRFDEYQNRSVYIGPSHDMAAREQLAMYRTFPKVNGNFRGVAKTAIKVTRDKAVTGVDGVSTLTAPMIGDVSFSIPVGVTVADVIELRQEIIALLDLDVIMTALNSQQMI